MERAQTRQRDISRNVGQTLKRPRSSPESALHDDWEEHLSRKYQVKYWFNKRTHESSWTEPRDVPDQAQGHMLEDSPRLALRREQLRVQCLHAFAEENSKYGEMLGDTKTARSCRADGMVFGLQGMFARVLWSQKMRETLVGDKPELDPVFPSFISEDWPVIKELIDAGRTEDEAKSVLLRLTSALQTAAADVSELKVSMKDLREQQVTLLASANTTVRATNELVGRQLYTLRFERMEYQLLGSHLTKLLRLYREYTNQSADWNDPDFVSAPLPAPF